MRKPDLQQVHRAMLEVSDLKGDTLRLPMPRRMEIPCVQKIKEIMLGDYWPVLLSLAQGEPFSLSSLLIIQEDKDFSEYLQRVRMPVAGAQYLLIALRHQMAKAPILTVSKGLSDLLEDTSISDDVPSKFFTPPFKTCYIEFDEAERRHLARLKVSDNGLNSPCEGCYVQESTFDKLPNLSKQAVECLELDRKKPGRAIELGFTATPHCNSEITGLDPKAAYDSMDFATIYIQDENEPIKEVLQRHFSYYRQRLSVSTVLSPEHANTFESFFAANFTFLTKVLFYLHIDRKEQRKVTDASDLEKRIEGVGEKKRDKLKRQLYRTYDHIVIGPSSYTPISERIDVGSLPKGTKAPHYRRATIGIRWTGTGQAKTASLVRIKESLINKHLIDQESTPKKDYIIK